MKDCTLEELSANVLEALQQQNHEDLLMLLQQLLEVVSLPGDKNCLIGPVVKILPSTNFEIKKRSYAVLSKLCDSHPNAALLAANILVRDSKDLNPEVKNLAVSAVCSLAPLVPLYAPDVLGTALTDAHPRIRRTAIKGCGKVFASSPKVLEDAGFVDRLYESIRDEDVHVVVGSLLVLDAALAREGGVVVNRRLAQYLIQRLPQFPAPQLATILQVLRKYTPRSEQELFLQLSLLDPYLEHAESAAVVVNCAQLFLFLIEKLHPHLEKDVVARTVPSLIKFIATGDAFARNYVLDFLLWTNGRTVDWLAPFSSSWELFMPRYSNQNKNKRTDDSSVLVQKKLLLLPRLCKSEVASEILKSLQEARMEKDDADVSRAFTNCIVDLVERLPPPASSEALQLVVRLLECGNKVLVDNVLQSLESLDVMALPKEEVLPLLSGLLHSAGFTVDIADKEYVSTLPPILPELLVKRGDLLNTESIACITECIVGRLPQLLIAREYDLAGVVLHMVMQLFLVAPASFQLILGRALQISAECSQQKELNTSDALAAEELKKKAGYYYSILHMDKNLDLVKKAVLGS